MSIPNTIDLIGEHIENAYNALETGGADLTNVNKNLTNINSQLINRYKDYLANGTDVIWNNWENKSTQEGENLHFNNTIKAKIKTELNGNINQNAVPAPDNPQNIHVVTGNNTICLNNEKYIPIEYLESTGTQYIDTGIKIKGNSTNFDITYQIVQFPTDSGIGIFGSWETNKQFRTFYSLSANTLRMQYYNGWNNITGGLNTDIHNIKLINGVYYLDDRQDLTLTLVNFEASLTSYLFATHSSQMEWANNGLLRIYSCKIYDSNILIRDFIPVLNNNGVACMYDKVTKQFFYNIGTGSFNAGKTLIDGETQLLSLGSIELRKIGDYQDKIFKAIEGDTVYDNLDSETKVSLTVGNWYKQNNIYKMTLTNTYPIEPIKSSTTTMDRFIYNIYQTSLPNTLANENSLCNRFVYNTENTIPSWWNNDNGNQIIINFSTYGTTTIDQFKTWVSNNNLILYQPRVTPTYTEITDTTLIGQLNNIEKIKSYNEQTNIWQENADIPFIINATILLNE